MAKSLTIFMLVCFTVSTLHADVDYYQVKTAERNVEADKSDREARFSRAKALSEMSRNAFIKQSSSSHSKRRSLLSGRSKQEVRTFKHNVHPRVMESIKSRRGIR